MNAVGKRPCQWCMSLNECQWPRCMDTIYLDAAEWERFMQVMQNPAPPTPAIIEGARLFRLLRKP